MVGVGGEVEGGQGAEHLLARKMKVCVCVYVCASM